MSKWIKKDLFESFQKEKIEEKDTASSGFRRSDLVWETPAKGTVENAKVYEGRFVPDPKGEFYKRYYYHFWQSGENWISILCPKTHGFDNYCPFCSAVSKLYGGTKQDKKQAGQLKRKEKFVSNFYIAKDSRDDDRDGDNKVVGKIKVYEFPSAVEKKIKNEITDKDEGYGIEIFDPSEEGRNFIIKVASTKKMEDGRQWPEYSSSTFSRSQGALGTDDEIEELMKQCVDITEYIASMETTKEKMVSILKNEFLWELVETECLAKGFSDLEEGGKDKKEEPKKEAKKAEEDSFDTGAKEEKKEEPKEEKKEEPKEEKKSETREDFSDIDDNDLLAELDKM